MDTECLISPRREKGEPEISGTTILCPNPADLHRLERLAKKHTAKQLFLYNSRFWQVNAGKEEFFICGPAVGAPMAVLSIEKLIALGSKRIIVLGTCGALSESLSIGDVFLPATGVSEEGASAHYPLAKEASVSLGSLDRLKRTLGLKNIESTTGKIWTIDAPYRETHQKIQRYKALDVQAVDMEFTALVTVAEFRKIDLAAVMVVSDSLSGDQWASGFSSKIFKKKCTAVCEAIFESCLTGEL